MQDMLCDAEESPWFVIPNRFKDIYNSKEMIELLTTIREYLRLLFRLEAK
jgi:hypothetical protein